MIKAQVNNDYLQSPSNIIKALYLLQPTFLVSYLGWFWSRNIINIKIINHCQALFTAMMATRSNIIRQGEFAISNDIADKLVFKLTLSLVKMSSRSYFEQTNFNWINVQETRIERLRNNIPSWYLFVKRIREYL